MAKPTLSAAKYWMDRVDNPQSPRLERPPAEHSRVGDDSWFSGAVSGLATSLPQETGMRTADTLINKVIPDTNRGRFPGAGTLDFMLGQNIRNADAAYNRGIRPQGDNPVLSWEGYKAGFIPALEAVGLGLDVSDVGRPLVKKALGHTVGGRKFDTLHENSKVWERGTPTKYAPEGTVNPYTGAPRTQADMVGEQIQEVQGLRAANQRASHNVGRRELLEAATRNAPLIAGAAAAGVGGVALARNLRKGGRKVGREIVEKVELPKSSLDDVVDWSVREGGQNQHLQTDPDMFLKDWAVRSRLKGFPPNMDSWGTWPSWIKKDIDELADNDPRFLTVDPTYKEGVSRRPRPREFFPPNTHGDSEKMLKYWWEQRKELDDYFGMDGNIRERSWRVTDQILKDRFGARPPAGSGEFGHIIESSGNVEELLELMKRRFDPRLAARISANNRSGSLTKVLTRDLTDEVYDAIVKIANNDIRQAQQEMNKASIKQGSELSDLQFRPDNDQLWNDAYRMQWDAKQKLQYLEILKRIRDESVTKSTSKTFKLTPGQTGLGAGLASAGAYAASRAGKNLTRRKFFEEAANTGAVGVGGGLVGVGARKVLKESRSTTKPIKDAFQEGDEFVKSKAFEFFNKARTDKSLADNPFAYEEFLEKEIQQAAKEKRFPPEVIDRLMSRIPREIPF